MEHKRVTFTTNGVCSTTISYSLKDGKIYNVKFDGGCDGNTQGLSKLLEGMDINDVKSRLEGIKCGDKDSSCPDQLVQALKEHF